MSNHSDKLNIAIDGPAGAGKSTVAKRIANKLHYIYVDTGAMYRAVAWKCMQAGIDASHENKVEQLVQKLRIQLLNDDGNQRVIVDGEDVTDQIRSNEVSQAVSAYARNPQVRQSLLQLQRQFVKQKGVVMDGRDIGTHIMPDADIKIYLTASAEVRAKRRLEELALTESPPSFEQLKAEIEQRDRDDQERQTAPLRKAEDAVEIDSSHLSIDEVVDAIMKLYAKKLMGE